MAGKLGRDIKAERLERGERPNPFIDSVSVSLKPGFYGELGMRSRRSGGI